MKSIYIQTLASEKIALLTEGYLVKQVAVDRLHDHSLVGNIYLGRIRRIDHSLQSAFVDIGTKALAFLPKKELPLSRKDPKKPIESIIHEGMAIFVQVIKDPYDNKGARVTANVTIPGHYFVYMPYSKYIAASKKIKGDKREQLEALLAKWMILDEGAIIRTSSLNASDQELELDWKSLQNKWKSIVEKSTRMKPPSILFEDKDIPDRFLRKFATSSVDDIIFDENDLAQEMKNNFPHLKHKIRWTDRIEKELPISMLQLIEKLTSRTVKLTSGIEIVIDKTEAFTVIDVNTGSFVGKHQKEQTILHTNIEAAKEIVDQIRFRNLAGVILIDFIDMRDKRNRTLLENEFRKLLKNDPTYCEVFGFTHLGILEMTRKREGLDSYSLFCTESKRELTDITIAFELERELLAHRKKDSAAFLVELTENVLEQFKQQIDFEKLKEVLKIPVYVQKKPLEKRHYVIKFIGDLKWLEGSMIESNAIDKLF